MCVEDLEVGELVIEAEGTGEGAGDPGPVSFRNSRNLRKLPLPWKGSDLADANFLGDQILLHVSNRVFTKMEYARR